MVAEERASVQSADPAAPTSRGVRVTRAAILMLAGIAIAFTATMHEQLAFDRGITVIVLTALTLAHALEWVRARPRTPIAPLLGLAALLAAIGVFFAESASLYAAVVAAWALISGLLEFIGATLRLRLRQDALLMGVIGILLAVLVLLVREDAVAILGFFGAYAVIGGVFLGISAFDQRTLATESDTGDPAAERISGASPDKVPRATAR